MTQTMSSEIPVSFSISLSHRYPQHWNWWTCIREYPAVEFDGKGMQQLGYLALAVGDRVVTLPGISCDGKTDLQMAQSAWTCNKYPWYFYVHSFKGSGWVPTLVLVR